MKYVRHPVLAAAAMERSPHVLHGGEGAENLPFHRMRAFAGYLSTPARYEQLPARAAGEMAFDHSGRAAGRNEKWYSRRGGAINSAIWRRQRLPAG